MDLDKNPVLIVSLKTIFCCCHLIKPLESVFIVPIGSFTKIGSVSLLGFPGPARFSAKTRNLYFFLFVRPLTLEIKIKLD